MKTFHPAYPLWTLFDEGYDAESGMPDSAICLNFSDIGLVLPIFTTNSSAARFVSDFRGIKTTLPFGLSSASDVLEIAERVRDRKLVPATHVVIDYVYQRDEVDIQPISKFIDDVRSATQS